MAEPHPTNDAGAVYVVRGPAPAATSLSAAGGTLTGEGAGDWAGYLGAAAVGDVDGDGDHDLLVDAFLNDDGGTDAGAAYLVLGPVSGVASLGGAAAELYGAAAGDLAGCAVSGAGDVDQDGVPDLLIGACLDWVLTGRGGEDGDPSYSNTHRNP